MRRGQSQEKTAAGNVSDAGTGGMDSLNHQVVGADSPRAHDAFFVITAKKSLRACAKNDCLHESVFMMQEHK